MRFLLFALFLSACTQGPLSLKGKEPATLLGKTRVGGFNHAGGVYEAELPLASLQESYFLVSRFAAVPVLRFAHTMVLFVSENPVVLFENETPSLHVPKGFAFSYNFAAEEGVEYHPLKGLFPIYQSTHNLRSSTDVASYVAGNDEKLGEPSTVLHRLNFTPEENRRLAEELLKHSTEVGTSESYHTAFKNCSSVVFDAIDKVATSKVFGLRPYPQFFSGILTLSPARAHYALSARGLLLETIPWQESKFAR